MSPSTTDASTTDATTTPAKAGSPLPDNSAHNPKSFGAWIRSIPSLPLTLGFMALTTLALFTIYQAGVHAATMQVEQARSTLAVTFSIATVVLAFLTILGAFLAQGKAEVIKERCGLAFQVLTPLIGIMGTILGFYFGTSSGTILVSPLKIEDVVTAEKRVIEGSAFSLTVLVQGGHGPWQYTVDFGSDIPRIDKKSGSPFLSESVLAPKLAKDTVQKGLGLTVTVTDATGATAEWSRKAQQWIDVVRAPAAPTVVTGSLTTNPATPPKTPQPGTPANSTQTQPTPGSPATP